jgi:hypothetical protein
MGLWRGGWTKVACPDRGPASGGREEENGREDGELLAQRVRNRPGERARVVNLLTGFKALYRYLQRMRPHPAKAGRADHPTRNPSAQEHWTGSQEHRIVTQLKIDGEALPELILWRPELEEGGGMRWLRRLEPQHRKN